MPVLISVGGGHTALAADLRLAEAIAVDVDNSVLRPRNWGHLVWQYATEQNSAFPCTESDSQTHRLTEQARTWDSAWQNRFGYTSNPPIGCSVRRCEIHVITAISQPTKSRCRAKKSPSRS